MQSSVLQLNLHNLNVLAIGEIPRPPWIGPDGNIIINIPWEILGISLIFFSLLYNFDRLWKKKDYKMNLEYLWVDCGNMEYRRAVLDTRDPSGYYLRMLYNNHPNCVFYLVYIEDMEKVYWCLTFNNVPYIPEVTQLVENMYIISQNNKFELFLQPFPMYTLRDWFIVCILHSVTIYSNNKPLICNYSLQYIYISGKYMLPYIGDEILSQHHLDLPNDNRWLLSDNIFLRLRAELNRPWTIR